MLNRLSFRRQIIVLLSLLWCGVSFASAALEQAATVSPGALSTIAPVRNVCPTFSWSAVERTTSFQLAVYELPAEAEGTREATQTAWAERADLAEWVILPGGATSWTPSMHHCLERGAKYVWFVRAVSDSDPGIWSEPRMFEVRSEVSHAEVKRIVESVMEQYPRPNRVREQAESPELGRDYSADAIRASRAPTGSANAAELVSTLTSPFAGYPAAIDAEWADATVANAGIRGITVSNPIAPPFLAAGVVGLAGPGARPGSAYGVYGEAEQEDGVGVYGAGDRGVTGVSLEGDRGVGVLAQAQRTIGETFGVAGEARSAQGYGGLFLNSGGGHLIAANDTFFFDTEVTSDLEFRVDSTGNVFADGSYNCGLNSGCFNTGAGADVAERIDVTEALEPGHVVAIDPDRPGRFRKSRTAYSTYVVGVVSDQPAITLNNNDLADNETGARTDDRPLLALVGKVPVLVSNENGPIRPGDFLTASSTPGHAMRCEGVERCFGRTIGKALEPLDQPTGRVLMMVVLQ